MGALRAVGGIQPVQGRGAGARPSGGGDRKGFPLLESSVPRRHQDRGEDPGARVPNRRKTPVPCPARRSAAGSSMVSVFGAPCYGEAFWRAGGQRCRPVARGPSGRRSSGLRRGPTATGVLVTRKSTCMPGDCKRGKSPAYCLCGPNRQAHDAGGKNFHDPESASSSGAPAPTATPASRSPVGVYGHRRTPNRKPSNETFVDLGESYPGRTWTSRCRSMGQVPRKTSTPKGVGGQDRLGRNGSVCQPTEYNHSTSGVLRKRDSTTCTPSGTTRPFRGSSHYGAGRAGGPLPPSTCAGSPGVTEKMAELLRQQVTLSAGDPSSRTSGVSSNGPYQKTWPPLDHPRTTVARRWSVPRLAPLRRPLPADVLRRRSRG